MIFFFEKYYIVWGAFHYEWNLGVCRTWLWPGKYRTDSGWSVHIGPFWFRKWR